MPIGPGQTLAHYRIVEKIGEGGMGVVWKAEDTTLKRMVALKVLPESSASDPSRLQRFQREAEAVAALNHPHIVTIHSVQEAEGTRFLTMELVEGISLDRLLQPGGLPLEGVFDIGIALADALGAAHERGVIHRDLKPANVMRTTSGRIKVLDFGLAKLAPELDPDEEPTESPTRSMTLTRDGALLGTLPYMSPEQVQGRPVDHRSDIFSLGVLLYELATGVHPFGKPNRAELISSILRDRPVPVGELRKELPQRLDRIITRCIEKDREDRYASAIEVRDELRKVRGTSSVAPRSRRTGTWVAMAGAALLIVMAASVWYGRDDDEPVGSTKDSHQASQAQGPSIAVLPFVDMSQDRDKEFFADGLSDELMGVLSRIRGLRVAARTSSFSFKGRDAKIADIGRDLNVATVLEGSVRTAGDRVRINAQLIDVAHGFELWSDSYDRELTDILQVQDEIAGAVARALQVTLLGEKTARREVSPEAYNAYLQGKYFANRLGEETLNSAITHYERALSIEHEWAEAWVGLAMALQWGARFDHIPVVEGFAQARFAVEQALRHDPDLAAAHAALGWIRWSWDFDFAGAGAAYRRALQLEPGNLDAINGSAHLARCLGDYDEAVALSRRAVELDPLNPNIHMYLAEHLLLMGRYAEAISAIQQTLRLNPDQVAGHWGHCWILLELDRPEEALVAIEKEVAPFFRLYGRILAQLELGRREEADAGLQQMIEEHAEYGALNIAFVYARRGEPDLAFEWLELAYEQRDTGLPYIKSILEKDLGSDPRWKPYLKKIGFPDSG